MSATSSISFVGTITSATNRREQKQAISQSVDQLELKQVDVHVPTSGSHTLNMNLATGVEECLVLCVYAPKKVILELTSTDTANAGATDGPMRIGVIGFNMLTMTPGEGVKTLTIHNPSAAEEVTVELSFGAVENSSDTPTFYV